MRPLGKSLMGFAFCVLPLGLAMARSVCEPELLERADRGRLGYQQRNDDTRCEGFLEMPTATEDDLELLSLVRGTLEYEPKRHRHLRISSPDVSDLTDEPVRVQAFGLYEGLRYRMDAVLPHGRPMIWPITSVLVPGGVEADQVGVYGMVGQGSERIFIPVSIAADHSDPDPAAPIHITVRTPVDVKRMFWRLAAEDAPWPKFQKIPRSQIPAGEWIMFVLPEGAPDLVRIQVHGIPAYHEHAVWLKLRVLRRSP